MNPKRRDSNCERQSPDYSTSSAASSCKNTNSRAASGTGTPAMVPRKQRMNLQECLREMNSVMRVLDSASLDPQSRMDELGVLLDNGCLSPCSSMGQPPLPTHNVMATHEIELLLRNQQALLKQIADSRSALSHLEQEYSSMTNMQRDHVQAKMGQAREMRAAVQVSTDANALVERLREQVAQSAEEYRRAQEALEGVRQAQRDMGGYDLEEEVFERGDPEGDAPVSDDNKINIQSHPRYNGGRRLLPQAGPLPPAPYLPSSLDFIPDNDTSEVEDKVRKLNETRKQMDLLRGMINKMEGRSGSPPKALRPVPVYPNPLPAPQQRRRQQLQEINRSLQSIEGFISREQAAKTRNFSVTDNPPRSSARPRFSSCNVQPWENYPLLEVPFGSQPRSVTEAATWGGSSTQENSDNADVGSECSDSEMDVLGPMGGAETVGTGARPKLIAQREVVGGANEISGGAGVGAPCENCSNLLSFTQMLTLSLVQAYEVINSQHKEIDRLKASARPSGMSGERPLNNQVTPGVRANNYVDNLKSYSTLNLLSHSNSTQPEVRRKMPQQLPVAHPAEARNDLNQEERRRPNNKNSMNQLNFCRYSSNPELNREATAAAAAAAQNKVSLAQLSRERLEMQPALDAASAFLSANTGQLCTPDILIHTCRCLLDHLTPSAASHKHILRTLQPTLGQFLARPVNAGQIMEVLTNALQQEMANLSANKSNTPPERAFAGVSDRSTTGNENPEDQDDDDGSGGEEGEEMAEADRTESEGGAVGGSMEARPSLDQVPTRLEQSATQEVTSSTVVESPPHDENTK